MSAYPLYDELMTRVITRPNLIITESYTKRLNDVLSACDLNQSEQITVLIITFYSKSQPSSSNIFTPDTFTAKSKISKLPYGIKCAVGMKGFSFCLDLIPNELKFLLGEYCELNN
ncbi:MAG: hypothetical protein Solivirus1_76 [Solivirus sp.]|jgi:hypothetical protein|uniref:Uncharacterized protein n=1 Tax=Solivirus sp. TaxID=2487772 RepID=A0A3G5AJS3_9VIRU|nr:MAG: hypothetical protein Solivirus1_76 [Solivirus sp.]